MTYERNPDFNPVEVVFNKIRTLMQHDLCEVTNKDPTSTLNLLQ